MKTYLITGGAGFIGSHVTKALLERGDEVISIDDFNDFNYPKQIKFDRIRSLLEEKEYKRKQKYQSRFQKLTLYDADIRDTKKLDAIAKSHKIDQICHLAARAGVRRSLQYPSIYYQVNVLGTLNMFELAVKHKIRSMVYASSSSVYGGVTKYPFKETENITKFISPYGATKKANEDIASTYFHVHKMRSTGLRFFTVYGPWGRPDMALYIFTEKIMKNKPIPVFNKGDMYRDFTYIQDIVQGVVKALDEDYACEVINLGNSRTEKLNDFIEILEKCLGKKAEREMLPMQEGDIPKTSAGISKAKRLLGFKPTTNIDKGIRAFVEWYNEYEKEKKKN